MKIALLNDSHFDARGDSEIFDNNIIPIICEFYNNASISVSIEFKYPYQIFLISQILSRDQSQLN